MHAFLKEYNLLAQNVVLIGGAVLVFIIICGIIRFSIAIKRRKNGTYPPAASLMKD